MTMQPGGVWTYRPGVQAGSDVVGYAAEATDGRIGKIDSASDEADAAHLVVDTGFWIFGKEAADPRWCHRGHRRLRSMRASGDEQGTGPSGARLGGPLERQLEAAVQRLLRPAGLLTLLSIRRMRMRHPLR